MSAFQHFNVGNNDFALDVIEFVWRICCTLLIIVSQNRTHVCRYVFKCKIRADEFCFVHKNNSCSSYDLPWGVWKVETMSKIRFAMLFFIVVIFPTIHDSLLSSYLWIKANAPLPRELPSERRHHQFPIPCDCKMSTKVYVSVCPHNSQFSIVLHLVYPFFVDVVHMNINMNICMKFHAWLSRPYPLRLAREIERAIGSNRRHGHTANTKQQPVRCFCLFTLATRIGIMHNTPTILRPRLYMY